MRLHKEYGHSGFSFRMFLKTVLKRPEKKDEEPPGSAGASGVVAPPEGRGSAEAGDLGELAVTGTVKIESQGRD